MRGIKKNKIVFFAVVIFLLAVFGFLFCKKEVFAGEIYNAKNSLQNTQKQIEVTKNHLNNSQTLLGKNVVQVASTKTVIQQTESDIAKKQNELDELNKRAGMNKAILSACLQQAYYADANPLVELAFANTSFSNISQNFDQMLSVKDKINLILSDINQNTQDIENVKSDLSDKKVQHESLLMQQKKEQANIVSDINATTATLAELQAKFDALQSELNSLLGTNYNAKDIKGAISYASSKTGVPQGVLYGFLTQESALGKNVGQCTYADVEKVSIPGYKKYGKKYQASIDRLYYREKLFNNILNDLGYKNKKVSCTISFSSAGPNQGGAMGAAQMMSDTWLAYESRISAKTGSSHPDPWNITDAVMAMAIKVFAAGGTSDSAASIRKSTTSYYGVFSRGYYDTVLYWSKNYKTLLN
jgi:peptidoglycan hydrolase CwlO-like protein